jgi:hypothetical protein
MTDTPDVLVKVRLANEVTLSWRGDVEFSVADESIVVYDYGLRTREQSASCLVFAARPGEWLTAWRETSSQLEPTSPASR